MMASYTEVTVKKVKLQSPSHGAGFPLISKHELDLPHQGDILLLSLTHKMVS